MIEIHRVESTTLETPVNAYLIEGERELVAVDGTLTVAGGSELRRRAELIGKPLSAVVLTHAPPDHYGGVVALVGDSDVPIIATAGVDAAIRRDDPIKEQILRPMFGEQWPAKRAFPTELVASGAELSFGEIELTVEDLGPGESPHDSVWFLGDGRGQAFPGDQGYNHMHGYLADGHWRAWLANIERLRSQLPADAVLHVGHGGPAALELLDWQRRYIECVVEATRGADWRDPTAAKATVLAAVAGYLESDRLYFLVELSIEPLAARLGLIDAGG